ncbi:DUF4123 domain-containing protein [Rodentibacter pneumotropicus]|uniref:DUF4123 domain-containing protein n=1 Tax=Rodentibacter pneumotropicus TaxID=758 RepID=UPI00233056B5|nr:DUF4123 domain-containing protein [Rodentibacter pneumotropicus]MDC2826498.1 DUF4123 domain-containing protein [Rodentibacter pneumotropicus]
MLDNSPSIWVQDAFQITDKSQDKVLILVLGENENIAKSYIQYYQMKHQLRFSFSFNILPLETYAQYHADEDLREILYSEAQKLSKNQPLFLFYPDRDLLSQTNTANLKKQIYAIPSWQEQCAVSTFALSEVPPVIESCLWNNESDDKCYAVILAANVWIFPDLFRQERLRYACLFQDEKAETYAKAAPYLVELPKNHPVLSRLFCRNGDNHIEGINYGERNIGTFFRSSADFDALLNHFRKWLMLQDYTGHWYYLRFFDPAGLEKYLDRLQTYPTKLSAFFNGGMIEKIFCIKNGDELVEYVPNIDLSAVKQAKKQFDKFEIEAFIELHDRSLCEKIIGEIMAQYPEFAHAYGKEIVEKTVDHAYRLAKYAKMKGTISILQLALANLIYGDSVNYLDPEKKLNDILVSDLTEQEKQFYLEKRFDQLEKQGRIRHQLQSTGAHNV